MVIQSQIQILDHISTSLSIAEKVILEFIGISHTVIGLFMKLGKVTVADQEMNLLHLGSEPPDTRI